MSTVNICDECGIQINDWTYAADSWGAEIHDCVMIRKYHFCSGQHLRKFVSDLTEQRRVTINLGKVQMQQ